MARHLTTAQVRKDLARVLRTAKRGTPVVVTSNGQPVAAVVSIEQLRALGETQNETLGQAILEARADIDPSELEGPDPWANVRDKSPGRDVDLD